MNMYRDEILHINEKSTEPTSTFVNCGAYHFDYNIFEYIDKTPVDYRFNERIITNTINMMIEDGISFYGIKTNDLKEITRIEDIEKVENNL